MAPPPAKPSPAPATPKASPAPTAAKPAPAPTGELKDRFLAEVRAGKGFFYNTVVAQAQKIEVGDDRVTFTFSPNHRALREQFEQARPWLEAAAERVAGRKVSVMSQTSAAADPPTPATSSAPKAASQSEKRDLKAEVQSSSAVQAMLEVFPAEIRDVEEM